MKTVKALKREALLEAIKEDIFWDVVVIGAGATGLGIALDAVSRGMKTLIVDAQDFASGTSSRSTKLIHGGVPYMKNPREWTLVRQAMKERKLLLENAPHVVKAKPFILPTYKKWEKECYTLGLGLYGAMSSGGYGIGMTRPLSAEETQRLLPGIKTEGLLGGVMFYDAQFDDAQLAISLMRTIFEKGGTPINYMRCTGVDRQKGWIRAVALEDVLTGQTYHVNTRMVFNATGAMVDEVRRLADPGIKELVRPSRGTHVVVDRDFMPAEAGMFIPKTPDGRVLFVLPWHGKLLLGTTDVAQKEVTLDPKVAQEDVDFILKTASDYLETPVTQDDVKATFAGIRPLFNAVKGHETHSTSQISREHVVLCEFGNMVSVTGGRWTAYRKMAEDAMLEATLRHLIKAELCQTKSLALVYDETWDAQALEEKLLREEADDELKAYAQYAQEVLGAQRPEDVLWRRLRIGQLDEARAKVLLGVIAPLFEAPNTQETQEDSLKQDSLEDNCNESSEVKTEGEDNSNETDFEPEQASTQRVPKKGKLREQSQGEL